MGYLKCDKCGGYYELQPGEKPSDFSDQCQCGGKLRYVESLKENKPKANIKNGKNIKKDLSPYQGLFALCCVGVVVIIVLAGAIFPNNNGVTANKIYTGQGITFNYPDDWNISDSGDIRTPNGMGTVGGWSLSDYCAGPPAIPATLNSVAATIRSGVEGSANAQDITVAGVPAIEYIPSSGSTGRAEVIFIKGNSLYDIYICASDYYSNSDGFNAMVKSIQFTS